MFISTQTTSWMKKAQPGNGQGQMPARMVGCKSCTAKSRFKGTEAQSVDEHGGRVYGWTLPLLFLIGYSMCLASDTLGMAQESQPPAVQSLKYAKMRNVTVKEPLRASPEEWAAARGVEALLVDQMIQEMRKSVPENDIIPVSHGEKIYRNMLDQEYSKILSETGSLGIADLVIAEMKGKK